MKNRPLLQNGSLIGLIFKVSLLFCAFYTKLNAQCIGTNNFPTGTISISPYVQTIISTNTFAGDYSIDNFGTAGEYVVNASFATFLTVTDNSNNPIASGFNPLTVAIPSSGNYRVHVYNTNTCGLGGGSRIVAVSPKNRAFSFDGSNDYIDMGTSINSALVSLNKITAEAWVYPTNTTFNGVIIGNYSTPANQMQFCLRRAGSLYQFFIGNSAVGGYIGVNSAATVTLNAWQHVAGTWDGSVARIYINGVLSGSASVTYPAFNNTTNKIWIGTDQAAGGEVFAGSIDEVRIWTRTLCQGEIQNNMNGSIPTTGTGLIANYHFDEGVSSGANASVTTLIDNSGNSYNGTVTNAALSGTVSNWVASTVFVDGTAAPAFVSPTVSVAGPTSVCSGNSVTLTANGNVSSYNWVSGPSTFSNVVTPTTTSTYSVTGTNSLGCISNMATYTVTYNVTPTVSVNSGSICPGNSFTITPSGAASFTIQGGASVVSPSVNTSYTVIGASSGCLSSNTATSNVVMGTCALAEALNTDGSNDYVSIPKSISSDFTIEYWMKTTQTGQTGPQWYFGNGVVDAEVGGVTNDFGTALVGGQLAFGIGNPDVTIFSTSNVNTGNWTHVAATWKQSTGEMKLYINGTLENTGTSGTGLRTAPPDIKIGVLGTLLRYLDINIDEVRLWNTVRTVCEINTYKNCEIPTSATGLVANYHFNQGYDSNPNYTITTLNDLSGNSNNGTLNNFALNGPTSNWIAPGAVVTGSTTPLPPPAVGSTVTNSVICLGNSTTLSGTGATSYTWSGGVTDAVAFSPTVTASYTVTGTATNGCTNTAVNTVTVNSLPTITVNSGAICSGNSFTMTPSGASTYTFSSGSAIVSPTANASYTITGTNAQGCSSNAVSNVTVNICSAAEALSFDGVDDYVDCSTSMNSVISTLNQITVEAWVNPANTAFNGAIIGNYSTPLNQMQFCLRRAGTIYQFFIGNGSIGGYINVNSAATVTVNTWQHVAGAWDGTVATIYVNGVSSGTASITYSAFGNSTNPIWIGANQAGGGEVFAGNIDETRIWNRALCQGEIINNMNGEIPTAASGLLANYHFNQGVAAQPNPGITTLNDATANAYTGTLTNMALTGTVSNWIAPGAVSTTVTPFASPTVAITGASAVCTGNSATLTANGNVTSYYWVSGPTTASNVVTPTVTATYSVSGSDLGCPSNMATFTVTVNNLPVINVATSSTIICTLPTQQTATLSSTGATTYTWSNSTNGSSTAVSPSVTTTYTVIGTDANGCENTAVITQSVSTCAGITQLTGTGSGISVYPNPGNGLFILEIQNPEINKEIVVINPLGEVVLSEKITGEKNTINMETLKNGIYFIEVIQNNTRQVIKLVKE